MSGVVRGRRVAKVHPSGRYFLCRDFLCRDDEPTRHPSDGKLKPIRDAALLCQGERRGLIAATAPPDEAHSGKGYAEKR